MILLDKTFLIYLLNDTIFLARKEVAMKVGLEKTNNGACRLPGLSSCIMVPDQGSLMH